jgi:hypothetical protein
MGAFQRFYAAWLMALTICSVLLRIALGLLIIAGLSWLIHRYSGGPIMISLFGLLGIWSVFRFIGMLGSLVGPPEPSVKSRTSLETRRVLRRTGMLRRH